MKGIQTLNSCVALWKIPALLLSVALACKPEQLAFPVGTRTAGRGHTHGIFLFANALSHSREAASGTRYFPGKAVIKAIGLSNYEKIIIKKEGYV